MRRDASNAEERTMHKQFRLQAAASPPDVEKLLRRLAEGEVNLAGVGGSNVEFGGEFAFAVRDGDEDAAIAVLEEHHYSYRLLEYEVDAGLTLCWLRKPNDVGELHRNCIEGIAAANLLTGRIIRDLLIGVPEERGTPVQVYSEEVRTPQSLGQSGSPGS
jgi:hypothetical protein